MKIASTVIAAFLLVTSSTNALAGSAAAGKISTIHFFSDGRVIFYSDGVRSNVPSCATTQPARFSLDGSTAGGKTQLAGILTAYAAGKQIVIYGRGSCDMYGDTETLELPIP